MACTVILELTLKPEAVDDVKVGLKDFLSGALVSEPKFRYLDTFDEE